MLNTFQLLNAIDSVDQRKIRMVAEIVNEQENKKKLLQETYDTAKSKTSDKGGKNADGSPKKSVIENKYKAKSLIQKETTKSKVKKLIDAQRKGSKSKKAKTEKTIIQNKIDSLSNYKHWYETISTDDKNNVPIKATQSSSRRKDLLRNITTNIKSLSYQRNKYVLRLNQQYSFAWICIVFLFIGAPLGSIIRKGGYGYPLLFAILFYMLFIITSIMGEKLVRSGSMHPILAAWFANLLVMPVAIWLTIKALRDSKFESNRVFSFIGSLFDKLKRKKIILEK
jgi:lipopolysaccharide export system permease protein